LIGIPPESQINFVSLFTLFLKIKLALEFGFDSMGRIEG
jgi:hypothetical protein